MNAINYFVRGHFDGPFLIGREALFDGIDKY
jgi:hypothetical protein